MELWIRSQDKCRLVPKPNLYAIFDKNNNIAYIGDKVVGHIGKYKSLERALEVLDEIQKILEPKTVVKVIDTSVKIDNDLVYRPQQNMKIQQLSTYVYEMPIE